MSSPSGASFSLRCLIYKVHAVPGGTLLLYSISFRLSRTFFRSFLTSDPSRISSNLFRLPHLSLAVKNFFHFFPAWLITAPTALLEYQILPLLSIPFSSFLDFEKVKQKMPCFFNKLFCVILYILGSAKRPPAKVPPVAYALSCYFRVLCVRFSLKYERTGAARPPPPSTRPAPCSRSARLKPFAGSCSSRFGFA